MYQKLSDLRKRLIISIYIDFLRFCFPFFYIHWLMGYNKAILVVCVATSCGLRLLFYSSLYSLDVLQSVAVLAADLVTGKEAGVVPPPECRMTFAEPSLDGRFVEQGIFVVHSSCLFLLLRPLAKGGFQCFHRSDDNRVGSS